MNATPEEKAAIRERNIAERDDSPYLVGASSWAGPERLCTSP
jgi:hypothetical protein